MALRDHFRLPTARRGGWESLHAQWPAMIVVDLNRRLPPRYVAAPRVHRGASMEIDVATFEGESDLGGAGATGGGGGVATAAWAPPVPTLVVATDPPDEDEYGVLIHDEADGERRLVAAVELVSPSNKDRPESRRAFAAKCAALLGRGVSVAIVDLVTGRHFSLYAELLDWIGQADPSLDPVPPPTSAAACRWTRRADAWSFESWAYPLAVGGALPTLPLWLADDLAVPLDLDGTYEATCRALRIP